MEKEILKDGFDILKDDPAVYDATIRGHLAALQKQYEEKKNTIILMHAFTEAAKYKRAIPKWIIKELDKAFRQYLYVPFEKPKDRSLDRLLGLKKGKGQGPAVVEFERRDRDVQLATTMDMLMRNGVIRPDAALIASERVNRGGRFAAPIGSGKVNQYYDGWKKRFRLEEIRQYVDSPQKVWEEILEKTTEKYLTSELEDIRKKYPHLFGKTPSKNIRR